MGRGLAKILAQKGANIVLVARDVKKLEAAIEYITVRPLNFPTRLLPFTNKKVYSPLQKPLKLNDSTTSAPT